MILYNVTVNIDNTVREDWLEWMQLIHIPEVMATGFFVSNQIARLINEEDNGGTTYAVQYIARTMEDLEEYQRDYAPALQLDHARRYKDKFVAFRTILEILDPNQGAGPVI